MKSRLIFLLVALALLAGDQVTKVLAREHLATSPPLVLIPGFAQLIYVENTGVAFGFLRDLPPEWKLPVFGGISLLALGGLLLFLQGIPKEDWVMHGAVGGILGGAVGNILDRIRFGRVTDFVDIFVGTYHWPTFNVADSAITCGVALLILNLIRSQQKQQVDPQITQMNEKNKDPKD